MNAFEIYAAAFDAAQPSQATVAYVKDYANEVLEVRISDEVAQQIVDCRNFALNATSADEIYHGVEAVLEAIEI
jgi:hypothetical protein